MITNKLTFAIAKKSAMKKQPEERLKTPESITGTERQHPPNKHPPNGPQYSTTSVL